MALASENFELRVNKAKIVALNNEIAKYAKKKELSSALDCFETARANNWANSHTYAAVINAYVRCGEIEEAYGLYNLLKSKKNGVRLDVISCTTMMKGFCSIGDITRSQMIIRDMENARPKIQPNIRTINTFLRGCVLAGALDEAEELFPRITRDFKLACDISSWEYIVNLLCQGFVIDKVLPIIGRLKNDKPNAGGVAAMCVNLARSATLLGELKISRKYLSYANQLLEDDEFQESIGSMPLEEEKSQRKATVGGKQAWKSGDPDDARAQSLEVYREHRRSELRQEVQGILTFLATNKASVELTLSHFKRILLFHQIQSSSVIENSNVVDYLLTALVKKLGFEKALEKQGPQNNEITNKLVKYSLIRPKEVVVLPASTPKKSKKKAPKPFDPNVIKVSQRVSASLEAMRQYLEDCFTPGGFLKPNYLFREEFRDLPTKLEICSGFGEWAVKQAVADVGRANWMTLELRQDRVYQTFTRSIFEGAENLAIIGGDALQILPRYFPENALTNVFVNYPEPPQQLGGNDTQGKHLLTEDFFFAVDRVLVDGGMLTILTDNLWYGRLLLKIVSSNSHQRHFSDGGVDDMIQETFRGFNLYMGKPGPNCGHLVDTSSYFDRLWQRGRQPDRYFLVVKKGSIPNMLNIASGKKRGTTQLQLGAAKKIRFSDEVLEES